MKTFLIFIDMILIVIWQLFAVHQMSPIKVTPLFVYGKMSNPISTFYYYEFTNWIVIEIYINIVWLPVANNNTWITSDNNLYVITIIYYYFICAIFERVKQTHTHSRCLWQTDKLQFQPHFIFNSHHPSLFRIETMNECARYRCTEITEMLSNIIITNCLTDKSKNHGSAQNYTNFSF